MRIIEKSRYVVRSIQKSDGRGNFLIRFYVLDRLIRKQVGPTYKTSTEAHRVMLNLIREGR